MKLLVAGSDDVDAGKTTFAVGLLEYAAATGFKPRAGNDYWFDHDDYQQAVSDGRLYGKDAARLTAASDGVDEPEALNPIHRLWRPNPGGGPGLLGQSDREFLLDRVGDTYVRNATVELPASAREQLPLADALEVASLAELNRVMERQHVPALEALAEDIAASERAVVESYGDVARPLSSFEPDAVAVVEPRRARLYPGRRYARACSVASGSAEKGQLEEHVSSVVDLIEPVASVELPALTGEEREEPSRVAAAYEPAFDALVATALE